MVDASFSHLYPQSLPDPGRVTPHSGPRTPARVPPTAGERLDHVLIQLGRQRTLVDRRLGPALARMHSGRLYRALGFVRLGDYLAERLGMSLRRCQTILRTERALAALPGLAAAFERGEISVSKLEVVAPVASAATETEWIECARLLSVDGLRKVVARCSAASLSSVPDSSVNQGSTSALPGLSLEQDEPGRFVRFDAPAPVIGIWHWTIDLIRRIAGQQEPAWRCIEYLAAEFLSGTPDVAGEPSRRSVGIARREAVDAVDPNAPPNRHLEHEEGGSASARDATGLDAKGRYAIGCEDMDAWTLDAHLRGLVRLLQTLAWREGRLLKKFFSARCYRDLGFPSFEDWVAERLSMSPRRARYLVSLERRLRDLPLLADAYRRGLVTWSQARLLVRVIRPTTQARWIRYARGVTVRRLEDVVIAREVAGGAAPSAAADAPDRHTSASSTGDDSPPSAPSAATDATDRQTSALSAAAAEPDRQTSASVADATAWSDVHAWRRISLWCPLEVAALWDSAVRSCRAQAGASLQEWECFLLMVQSLRDSWENTADPAWRRRYRILERDGWRCKAPGCTSRSGLNEHHVRFRSQQGGDEQENLVTLCVGHHQLGVHAGHVRCSGRAPDALRWDLGVRDDGVALVSYFGDRIMDL